MGQTLTCSQLDIFDLFNLEQKKDFVKTTNLMIDNHKVCLDMKGHMFDDYNIFAYENDILTIGLKQTWQNITNYALNNESKNDFLHWSNFSKLYEIGLALQDKELKKDFGQYYTPDDVAFVMSKWLNSQLGDNICDVGCGTGKLILSYLNLIGEKNAINLIRDGRLYLYDIDDVALNICKTTLLLKYGKELEPFIHAIHCDFLSQTIILPQNSKVISNPPYSTVGTLCENWSKTDVALNTKELYSMFMEKIITQSKSSVIITPYSFMSGSKFYTLRKLMNNYNGFIISFDNVPGNIFCGKKHGIFNTNTSNSVRAAITVVENKNKCKGFKTTPLIRFKNVERKDLLTTEILENFISDEYQVVSEDSPMYYKCAKELADIWNSWKRESNKNLRNYISQHGQNTIFMPNTCRYFTTASNVLMNRIGQIALRIDDRDIYNYIFCFINSSFAYWYWRLFDGGITYPRGLLLSMPLFYEKLSDADKTFFNNLADEMIRRSNKYKVIKNNVGIQENIKYPRMYRDKINRRLLDILGLSNLNEKIFDIVHSNMALEVNV